MEAFDNVKDGNIKKGDLFAAARFAAINASKNFGINPTLSLIKFK